MPKKPVSKTTQLKTKRSGSKNSSLKANAQKSKSTATKTITKPKLKTKSILNQKVSKTKLNEGTMLEVEMDIFIKEKPQKLVRPKITRTTTELVVEPNGTMVPMISLRVARQVNNGLPENHIQVVEAGDVALILKLLELIE